jgi:hypothetical protein
MVRDRPTVVIAAEDASAAARAIRRDAIALVDLPTEPFPLASRGLLAYSAVRSADDCEAVLVALTRGVDLVVTLEIAGSRGSAFVDDLARIADVSTRDSNPLRRLSADQVALLEALAAGRTLTDVARASGMSRRTATRRLADARAVLGAATTIEALRRFEQLRP